MKMHKNLIIVAENEKERKMFKLVASVGSPFKMGEMIDMVKTTVKHYAGLIKNNMNVRGIGDKLINVMDFNSDCTHVIIDI